MQTRQYVNIGRAIGKKVAIKISGNEVLPIDNADVYYCYNDLCKTTNEKLNSAYQGIDVSIAPTKTLMYQ